ncbi:MULTISPECIES: hypothetical protein [unclassified Rhizobium]|uniref:hypothetical protein n=1 Tax=unclassified Rhizobium TaxID=2613769 RepID=UPI0017828402|nr:MULTISPECIES: hypothetical protein [unclassified Rhizobium]MBD8689464.1 hypothetical protein [Rhizobium sp. CFBP 13644]MBD8693777.1 hypothetical protein [Rhizobium sp. CFBP 13717]
MEDFVDRTKIISAADLETGLSGLFFARNAQCVARSPDDQHRLQVSWKKPPAVWRLTFNRNRSV